MQALFSGAVCRPPQRGPRFCAAPRTAREPPENPFASVGRFDA